MTLDYNETLLKFILSLDELKYIRYHLDSIIFSFVNQLFVFCLNSFATSIFYSKKRQKISFALCL